MILTLVIMVLLLGFLMGYKVGVIRIALSMCIGIFSLVLVSVLTAPISNFIVDNTTIDDKLSDQMLQTLLEQGGSYIDADGLEVPIVQQINIIETSHLPEFLQNSLLSNNSKEVYDRMGVGSFLEYLGAYIARWIIKAVVFIAVFIAVFLGMRILAAILNVLSMLPIIHEANKLLGGILGVVCSLLLIWIMFMSIDIMHHKEWSQEAKVEIYENKLLHTIYSGNVLIKIIGY